MNTLTGTLTLAGALVGLSAAAAAQAAPAPAAPAVAAAVPHAAPTAGVERTVPVANRVLARGTTLSPSDYDVVTALVRASLRTAAAAESGWVTRRPVAVGEPLVEPAVGPPALVAAGQPVSYVSQHEGVRLAIRGTAATSGALGDRVWVRVDAGRRLRGVVTAPATVRADTASLR